MKNHLLHLILILAAVAILAACGGETAEPTSAPTAESQPEPTEAPPTAAPTEEPAAEASEEPAAEASEEPAAEATEEPAAEPTEEPIIELTAEPAAEPTAAAEATIDAPEGWPAAVSALPEGDPARGQALYMVELGCNGCHGDPGVPGSNAVGPHHGNIGIVGAERVAGQSAAVYIYDSILNPNAFIAPECANGAPCTEPSAMPADYGQRLSQQDMADLIAYMLRLTEE